MSTAATNHVMRDLQRSTGIWATAGQQFPFTSVEDYAKSAIAWLKDCTELSTKTIESADYQVPYEYFKQFAAPEARLIVEKLSGSLNEFSHALPTQRFLGVCGACVRPLSLEGQYEDYHVTACPECGQLVRMERLYAVKTAEVCDASCMNATRPDCECGCGGANHGLRWGVNYHTSEMTTTALARYREQVHKRAEAAERRRQDKAARQRAAMAQWREENWELIESMELLREDSDILADFLRQVQQEPLTPRQYDFAQRLIHEVWARRERRLMREERNAALAARSRHKGSKGQQVSVTGEVTTVRDLDGAWGARRFVVVTGTGGDDGVTAVWGGTARAIWALEEGQVVTLTGTVKEHGEYEGVKQTELTRCTVR